MRNFPYYCSCRLGCLKRRLWNAAELRSTQSRTRLKRISCRSQPLWKICISANILFRSLSGLVTAGHTSSRASVKVQHAESVLWSLNFQVWIYRQHTTTNNAHQHAFCWQIPPIIGSNVAAWASNANSVWGFLCLWPLIGWCCGLVCGDLAGCGCKCFPLAEPTLVKKG